MNHQQYVDVFGPFRWNNFLQVKTLKFGPRPVGTVANLGVLGNVQKKGTFFEPGNWWKFDILMFKGIAKLFNKELSFFLKETKQLNNSYTSNLFFSAMCQKQIKFMMTKKKGSEFWNLSIWRIGQDTDQNPSEQILMYINRREFCHGPLNGRVLQCMDFYPISKQRGEVLCWITMSELKNLQQKLYNHKVGSTKFFCLGTWLFNDKDWEHGNLKPEDMSR